jgi:hypothetical protein
MTPPAAPPAPRPTLAQLAAQGTDKLTEQLQRALPGDATKRPSVAAFNSSI